MDELSDPVRGGGECRAKEGSKDSLCGALVEQWDGIITPELFGPHLLKWDWTRLFGDFPHVKCPATEEYLSSHAISKAHGHMQILPVFESGCRIVTERQTPWVKYEDRNGTHVHFLYQVVGKNVKGNAKVETGGNGCVQFAQGDESLHLFFASLIESGTVYGIACDFGKSGDQTGLMWFNPVRNVQGYGKHADDFGRSADWDDKASSVFAKEISGFEVVP